MLKFDSSLIDKEVNDYCYYIINKYLNDNKSFDKEFFLESVETIKNIKSLEKYIKTVEIDEEIKDLANYHMLTKNIVFNYSKIQKELEDDKDYFNNKEYEIYKFLRSLALILHEIEHGNQRKIMDTENTLESKILLNSVKPSDELSLKYIRALKDRNIIYTNFLKNKLKRKNNLYSKYYTFAPEERLAYIKSYNAISNVASLYDCKKLKDHVDLNLNYSIIEAYLVNPEPTMFYLKKINPKSDYKKINELKDTLNLSERILYGLNISEDEQSNIIDETMKIHSHILKK